jgi:trimethylamine:corrinoid methyltransferase-like protein
LIDRTGPGGDFLSERSTVDGIRGGEWYVSKFGVHDTFEGWEAAGRPTLLEEAREKVQHILATHEPLPLDEDVERELDRIQKRAQAET